jgi:hypothetical protein
MVMGSKYTCQRFGLKILQRDGSDRRSPGRVIVIEYEKVIKRFHRKTAMVQIDDFRFGLRQKNPSLHFFCIGKYATAKILS